MAERRIFKNISPKTWEHPADRAAMLALKQIPALDQLVQSLLGLTADRSLRLLSLSSRVRVNEKQFSKVNTLIKEACLILDCERVPEVYVSQEPKLNAMAIGVENPHIVLHSAMVEKLSDEQLLCVLGHELAHIMSGHALYKTLLYILVQIGQLVSVLPVADALIIGVILALREWDRKSEMSADRAGLLVVQDLNVSKEVLMILSGGTSLDQMDLESFTVQAQEYEAGGDILDSVHKLLNLLGQTHPFPVLRLNELGRWYNSGSYQSIFDGEYSERGEKDNLKEDFDKAGKAYRDEMDNSADPLAKAFSSIGKQTEAFSKEVGEQLNKIFRDFTGQ